MRTEKEIKAKLNELQSFCKKERYTLEEMQGEIQGLKFCLDELNNL
jgi:hypothetical protein